MDDEPKYHMKDTHCIDLRLLVILDDEPNFKLNS